MLSAASTVTVTVLDTDCPPGIDVAVSVYVVVVPGVTLALPDAIGVALMDVLSLSLIIAPVTAIIQPSCYLCV
jgi:hypothetical protein